MITPFVKFLPDEPDSSATISSATVRMSWVSELDRRASFVCMVDALTAAQKHICQQGCGRVGDNHCTRCQQLEAVLTEAMGVLEAWRE